MEEKRKTLLRRTKEIFMGTSYGPFTTIVAENTMRVNMPVSDIDVEVEIVLPATFPHTAPEIRIQKPFPGLIVRCLADDGKVHYIDNPKMKDELTGRLKNHPLTLSTRLEYYWPHAPAKIHELLDKCLGPTIDHMKSVLEELAPKVKPPTTEHSLLILGSHPKEDRRGRTFYDDPDVYLLDATPVIEEAERERYYQIDFRDASHMAALAFLIPNAFDEICFDESTTKFFNYPLDTLQSRIQSIHRMLKVGGVFYVDKPGHTGSGTIQGGVEIFPSHKDEFLQATTATGLVLLAEDNDTFPASRYKKAIGRTEPPATFVKPVEKGGRRRKQTKRSHRKYYRRSSRKRNRKH
jgi:SAM-dependent methyltransferase